MVTSTQSGSYKLCVVFFAVMHKKVHDHPSGDLKDNHTIERDHTVEGGHTAEDAIDGNTVGHEKEYHSVKDREYAQTAGYYPDGHGGRYI